MQCRLEAPVKTALRRPLMFYLEPSYANPPYQWWKSEFSPKYVPVDTDYAKSKLSPMKSAPQCYSVYEINSITGVKSKWTP